MKTLISTLCILLCSSLLASSEDYMLIHKKDGSVITIAVADIDSSTFISSVLPGDSMTHYYEIDALSKDVAYMVTNTNMLLKTTDGGINWTEITPSNSELSNTTGATPQVSFFTEDIGCVSFSVDDGANGYNTNNTYGYVWCTTDGGATWSEKFDVNEDQILVLEQINDTVVYVSGTARLGVDSYRWYKKITRTKATNNYTLSSISSPPSSFPHVIAGDWLDESTGIMLFKNNTHYLTVPYITTNGGSTWSSINGNLPSISQASYSICGRSLKAVNSSTFFYVVLLNGASSGKLWRTTNGGSNWTEVNFDVTPVGRLTSIDFLDENNGIVAGYDSTNYFYTTNDGGVNWVKTDLSNKTSLQHLLCTEYAPDGYIWLTGYYQGLWRKE